MNSYLATQNKSFDNFSRKLKKLAIKLSIEGPTVLISVSWSQILSVIAINKVQSFS